MLAPTLTIDGRTLNRAAGVRPIGNLQIQWGRRHRLDQPQPATMSIGVFLDSTEPEILDWLAPGKRFTITAATPATTATRDVFNRHISHSINASGPLNIAPASIQPSTGNPTAWDTIPRVQLDSRLHLDFTANLPKHHTLTARAIYYADPFGKQRRADAIIYTTSTTGTTTHRTQFNPPRWANGMWCGIEFRLSKTGNTIDQERGNINAENDTFDSLTADRITSARLQISRSADTAHIISGRITDAVLEFDEDEACPRLDLTGVDFSGELANVFIGDAPFPAEDITTRLSRILNLSGKNVDGFADPDLSRFILSRKDVDNQPVLRVLEAAARSVGGILWPICHHSGDFFRIEDPLARTSLYRLEIHNGQTILRSAPWNGVRLPASLVYRKGIHLYRDTSDLATVVNVGWKKEYTDPKGLPAISNETVTVHDITRAREYGTRTLSYDTELASEDTARTLANQLLTQTAPGSWHLPGAEWDTALNGSTPELLIGFLDSAQRIGLPVTITGAESWLPGAPNIPVYLDGGRYTYDGKAWNLNLTFTRAATASRSITIDETPAAVNIDTATLTFNEFATATI